MVEGIRGPKGGYRLARERRRVSVGEIVRTILEFDGNGANGRHALQSDLGHWWSARSGAGAEDEFLTQLDQITVEELCRRARAVGLATEPAKPLDFTI